MAISTKAIHTSIPNEVLLADLILSKSTNQPIKIYLPPNQPKVVIQMTICLTTMIALIPRDIMKKLST